MIKDDFEDCYIPEPNTGCWRWVRYRQPNGYGQLCLDGHRLNAKKAMAHRYSYERHIGPIPPGIGGRYRKDVAFRPWPTR